MWLCMCCPVDKTDMVKLAHELTSLCSVELHLYMKLSVFKKFIV